MHELSIARNIVAIACERAGRSPVKRVTLEIGALAGVMAGAVAFCFPVVAAGTLCERAELEIREIAARARCRACGLDFGQVRQGAPCPCGSSSSDRLSGTELNVKSMELETV